MAKRKSLSSGHQHAYQKLFVSDSGDFRVAVVSETDEVVATFNVIGSILASWSDVFAAMLGHEMTEASSREVRLKGFSVEAVEAFLKTLYTGSLEASAATVCVEVAGLGGKYAVEAVEGVAIDTAIHELKPTNACAVLACAKGVGNKHIMDAAFTVILKHGPDALKQAHILDQELLETILSNPGLRISDSELCEALLALKARQVVEDVDFDELVEKYVCVSAIGSMDLRRVGLMDKLATMDKANKPGVRTEDLFTSLVDMWEERSSSHSFPGYWLNTIPSRPDLFAHRHPPCGMDEHRRCNTFMPALPKDTEVRWWMPHHCILLTGIQLRTDGAAKLAIEVSTSSDGLSWRVVLDTQEIGQIETVYVSSINCCSHGQVHPCRSKFGERWLRLRALDNIAKCAVKFQGFIVNS